MKLARFSGIIGAVLVLFGLIGSLVLGSWTNSLMLAHLVIGGLALLGWLVGGEAGEVLTGRATRFGTNVFFYAIVFLGILGALNYLVDQRFNKRWDLTQEGVYSLAPASEDVLKQLKKPLKLVAIKNNQQLADSELQDRLDLYRSARSDLVSFEFIDPASKPQLIDKYELKRGDVLYIGYGEGENLQSSRIQNVTPDKLEENITNAILKLVRGESKKVYYVTGHDEPDILSPNPDGAKELADALNDEQLKTEPILLAEHESVPSDAAAIILAAPRKPLIARERDLLIKFVHDGGSLLMLYAAPASTDVRALANEFSISIGNDVVIDEQSVMFGAQAYTPVVHSFGVHPITQRFTKGTVAVFGITSSVKGPTQPIAGVTYAELAKSSATAWAETTVEGLFAGEETKITKDANDVDGPVTLAVAYEKKLDQADKDQTGQSTDASSTTLADAKFTKAERVVVFGNADWAMNANIGVYSNRDLLLNSINWLVGQEGGLTIGRRSLRASESQPIMQGDYWKVLTSSFLIPELLLLMGLFVWWRRRAVSA